MSNGENINAGDLHNLAAEMLSLRAFGPENFAMLYRLAAGTIDLLDERAKPVAAALPASDENPWLIVDSLLYRLNEYGVNCDEINVTMADGSRRNEARKAAAQKLLALLTATPALPAEKVQGLTEAQRQNAELVQARLEQIHAASDDSDVLRLVDEAMPCINAILAASAGVPAPAKAVHQFRKRGCSDWYDGHPDHSDGGGPYESRTLYARPAPALPVVPEGYKIVPIEPTVEMLTAPSTIIQAYGAKLIYQRMIAAAPELPEGNQQPQTLDEIALESISGLAIRPSAEPAGQHDAGVSTSWGPQQTRERFEDYAHIAHLIGAIFFAGDFKAETANERELEALLVKTGHRYASWSEIENFRKDDVPYDLTQAAGSACQGGNTNDKTSLAPSHAASTEPVSNFTATQAAQPTEQFTERQILAAGRALSDRSSEYCNVNKEDNWNIYSADYIADARAAIDAAILASQSEKGEGG